MSSHQSNSEPRTLQRRYSRGADEFHTAGYSSPHGLLQKVRNFNSLLVEYKHQVLKISPLCSMFTISKGRYKVLV